MPTLGDGTLWRYRIVGSDPGDGWESPTYDDSSWSIGPQPIGTLPDYGDSQTNWPSAPVNYLHQRLRIFATTNGTMTVTAWDDNGIQGFYINGGSTLVGSHTHEFYNGNNHSVAVPVVQGQRYVIAISVVNLHGPGYAKVVITGPADILPDPTVEPPPLQIRGRRDSIVPGGSPLLDRFKGSFQGSNVVKGGHW